MSESNTPLDPRRTWMNQELELIVSGAVVFSLFQLPDAIEHWWLWREGQFGGGLGVFVFSLYYIATVITYGLVFAFGGHFLLRGMWVALVGLRSAFPGGIIWEKIQFGQTLREYYQRKNYTLSELEHRVDVLASSVFAFLFVFVIYTLLGVLLVAVFYLIAWLLAFLVELVAGIWIVNELLVGIIALSVGLGLIVSFVDGRQRKGKKVPAWMERFAQRLIPLTSNLFAGPIMAPITLTFVSYISRRTMTVLLVGFVYCLLGLFLVNVLVARGIVKVDSYIYLPVDKSSDTFSPQYYDNLRQSSYSRIPSLSSDIATEPYLRLFVPYDAREDNERVAALCPDLPAQRAGRAVALKPEPTPEPVRAQILDCFNIVYQVSLDDQTITPDWIFAKHPDFGERGLMAYLPTSEITTGRHLLVVKHRPLPDMDPEEDTSKDEFFIPFWK